MPRLLIPVLLDVKEAAQFLGITQKSLKSLVRLNKLEPRYLDGKIYFYEEELYQYRREEQKKAWLSVKHKILSAMGVKLTVLVHGDNGSGRAIDPTERPREVKG